MTAASPRVVLPGHVVRVRLGGHVYSSPVLSPELANAEHQRVVQALIDASGSFGTFLFSTADGRKVAVRARSVSAVEVGPPPAHKDIPVASVVHVHMHLGDDVDEETRGAAEAVAVDVPTPLLLASRRRDRADRR